MRAIFISRLLLPLLLLLPTVVTAARKKQTHSIVRLSIPWPSGIEVDKVTDSQGNTYRFGRLQHNSVSLRPEWRSINQQNEVLSETDCSEIIRKAELYAATFGWSKGRHVDYSIRPTKDLPIEVIFKEEAEFFELHRKIRERLLPVMAQVYGLDASKIRPTDLFITKYNASSSVERQLALHKDKSPWSFVVALNDGFSGGGTFFQADASLWQIPVGAAVFFNGNQLHGANAITQGVRYILAGFCEYGEDLPLESVEAHAQFMEEYDPVYDGYAAQSGFLSGDLIVGIEVCNITSPSASDVSHNTAAIKNYEDNELSVEISSKGQVSINTIIARSKQDITGQTSDAEWIAFAKSCEQLEPGSNTVLWVKRRTSRASKKVNSP